MRAVGNYQLEHVLGQGGMGVVYLARHAVLHCTAAVKIARPDSDGAAIRQRFLDEARVTSAIDDPGVVRIFDYGEAADGTLYQVMEHLVGERLDHRLVRAGQLTIATALRLAAQLAASLAAVHRRGVVHRDLKPENVMVVADPAVAGGERTKLLDFGICKQLDLDRAYTATGTIVGTPSYMSPEQCRGERDLGPPSDVYALGCLVFFVIAGRAPFPYVTPGELLAAHLREAPPALAAARPGVSAALDRLVGRMLAKAPRLRPTMAEVHRALTDDLRGASEVSTLVHPAFGDTAPPGRTAPTARAVAASATTCPAMPRPASTRWRQRAVAVGVAVVALSAHAPRDASSPDGAARVSSVSAAPAVVAPASRLVRQAPCGPGVVRAPVAPVKPPVRPPGARRLTPVRPLLSDAGPDGATPDARPPLFDAGVDSPLIDPWSTR